MTEYEIADLKLKAELVAAYLKNNEKTRARGVKQGKVLNLTMKHGRG